MRFLSIIWTYVQHLVSSFKAQGPSAPSSDPLFVDLASKVSILQEGYSSLNQELEASRKQQDHANKKIQDLEEELYQLKNDSSRSVQEAPNAMNQRLEEMEEKIADMDQKVQKVRVEDVDKVISLITEASKEHKEEMMQEFRANIASAYWDYFTREGRYVTKSEHNEAVEKILKDIIDHKRTTTAAYGSMEDSIAASKMELETDIQVLKQADQTRNTEIRAEVDSLKSEYDKTGVELRGLIRDARGSIQRDKSAKENELAKITRNHKQEHSKFHQTIAAHQLG